MVSIEASRELALKIINNHIFGIPVEIVKREVLQRQQSADSRLELDKQLFSKLTRLHSLVFYQAEDTNGKQVEFVRPLSHRDTIKTYVHNVLREGKATAAELAGDFPLLTVVNQETHQASRQQLTVIEQTLDDLLAQYTGGQRSLYANYMAMGLSDYSFDTVLLPELKRLRDIDREGTEPASFMSSLSLRFSKHVDSVNKDYVRQCLHQLIGKYPKTVTDVIEKVVTKYKRRFHSQRQQLEAQISDSILAGIQAGVWQTEMMTVSGRYGKVSGVKMTEDKSYLYFDVEKGKPMLETRLVYTLFVAYLLGVPCLTFSELIETNILDLLPRTNNQPYTTDRSMMIADVLLTALQRLRRADLVKVEFGGWTLVGLEYGGFLTSFATMAMRWAFNNNLLDPDRDPNREIREPAVTRYNKVDLLSRDRDSDATVQLIKTIDPTMIAKIEKDGTVIFHPYNQADLLARNQQHNHYRTTAVTDAEVGSWIQLIHELQGTQPPPPPSYSQSPTMLTPQHPVTRGRATTSNTTSPRTTSPRTTTSNTTSSNITRDHITSNRTDQVLTAPVSRPVRRPPPSSSSSRSRESRRQATGDYHSSRESTSALGTIGNIVEAVSDIVYDTD